MKTLPGKEFNTEKSALLNIGNLREIFSLGEIFDNKNYTITEYQT